MSSAGCPAARPADRAGAIAAGCAGLLVAACVSESPHRISRLELEASVANATSRVADGAAIGPLVWGLGPGPFGTPADAASAPAQDPNQQGEAAEEARIRAQFGSSVLIGADGRVTKQYFLAGELGPTFLKLIQDIVPGQPLPVSDPKQPKPLPPPGTKVGGPDAHSILGRMLGGREIEVTYLDAFEDLRGAAIADKPGNAPPTVTGQPLPLNPPTDGTQVALVLVTAQPSALAAFESALDLFYTSIPQVEITVQVIEYTNADALAFGVTSIDAGPTNPNPTPNLQNLSPKQLIQSYTSIFPLRAPVVGSSPVTDFGAFTLGGIHDGWELNALIQALEANNLADITSSPKLVVRNGGTASISTLTDIPFPKAKINQLGSQVATEISFKPVGVKMNIIPIIAGTDSIILQVYADVSAVTGFASTDPVVTPVTSTRNAVTTVYLKNNHTLVIGGLVSESLFENETKVPLLGDIPVLGLLFRSTSTSRQKTTIAFHITPRILQDRGSRVQDR